MACWHSERAGLGVLKRALSALRNRQIIINEVIYLFQDNNRIEIPEEINGAKINPLHLKLKDPTMHDEVYNIVRDQVLPKMQNQKHLHVNISPGTPAMHSVWIVLHAGGHFPLGARLWSSQFNPETKRTRIDPVNFPVTTYLSEVHKISHIQPEIAVYEPEAISNTRRSAFEKLSLYAKVKGAPLLILGERGTGKTRLVETFVASLKQTKKVITVPCGGLDSTLAESLLFGHKKGAFTGAIDDRTGLLIKADGGILFLDEVQDLPKTAQRQLVRVFQDRNRKFRPVGSDEEISVNIELVCASNLDLQALQERLDADLFDRISHLIVTVPPLRNCREDLKVDWQKVWNELRLSDNIPPISPWSNNLELTLKQHSLPGNIRDLQRLAELTMAWMSNLNINEAIEKAQEDWQSMVFNLKNSELAYGEGTRSERINWFKYQLAKWAKAEFLTWKAAANALGCDEKTLRQDSKL